MEDGEIVEQEISELIVEDIVDCRRNEHGEEEWLIKWKRVQNRDFTTWELKSNLLKGYYESIPNICSHCTTSISDKDNITCYSCTNSYHQKCFKDKYPTAVSQDWRCDMCRAGLFQCFKCKIFGKLHATELVRCAVPTCHKIYHKNCFTNSATGALVCGHHTCRLCERDLEGENCLKCFLCPTAFHFHCYSNHYFKPLSSNWILCSQHDLQSNTASNTSASNTSASNTSASNTSASNTSAATTPTTEHARTQTPRAPSPTSQSHTAPNVTVLLRQDTPLCSVVVVPLKDMTSEQLALVPKKLNVSKRAVLSTLFNFLPSRYLIFQLRPLSAADEQSYVQFYEYLLNHDRAGLVENGGYIVNVIPSCPQVLSFFKISDTAVTNCLFVVVTEMKDYQRAS